MSRAARRLTAQTIAEIQRATGYIGKSSDLAQIIAPLCDAVASRSRQEKKLKRLNDALVRLIEHEQPQPRRVAAPRDYGQQTMPFQPDQWRTELTPNLPPARVNGHDLGRVASNGQAH